MKKHFKYLATAGLIAALLLAAGCGDDAKDKKKVDNGHQDRAAGRIKKLSTGS